MMVEGGTVTMGGKSCIDGVHFDHFEGEDGICAAKDTICGYESLRVERRVQHDEQCSERL